MIFEEETNKLNDKLGKLASERENLKRKRDSLIKRHEKKLAKLDSEIEAADKSFQKIEDLRTFDRATIMPVIAYLVSKVEGKKYYYCETITPVIGHYAVVDPNQYSNDRLFRVGYLCRNKKEALVEINNYIKKLESNYSVDELNRFILEPKQNYVQLCFYSNMSGKSIIFLNNINNGMFLFKDNSTICYEETTVDFEFFYDARHSIIRDERYLYIIDFVEFLAAKRLEKENFLLTEEEMFRYAEEYAKEYRKENLKRVRKYVNEE